MILPVFIRRPSFTERDNWFVWTQQYHPNRSTRRLERQRQQILFADWHAIIYCYLDLYENISKMTLTDNTFYTIAGDQGIRITAPRYLTGTSGTLSNTDFVVI
jgi:hypothetical protein